jgi:hypothetical protein
LIDFECVLSYRQQAASHVSFPGPNGRLILNVRRPYRIEKDSSSIRIFTDSALNYHDVSFPTIMSEHIKEERLWELASDPVQEIDREEDQHISSCERA